MPLGALAGGWLVSGASGAAGRETALRLPYAASAVAIALLCLYCHRALKLDREEG